MDDKVSNPARLEAFSDGVIAVIITVMVLEIKVPHADGLEGLRGMAPALVVYLMSFAFTGIYWLNHQHIIRRAKAAGHSMQIANLGFLFCLSLLPVSTAYVVEKHLSGFAVALYAASLLVVALSFLWLRLAAHDVIKDHETLSKDDSDGLRNHVFSLFFYAGSIIAAFYYPRMVLLGIASLTAFWALPNLSLHNIRKQHA